ncbi:NB-ARC domain-containing protein [Microcoleus anatoxicus]|uniref:NB-ARC domain-containing protein n=1 Tax=Microcoleus anatoxicus TaxID=2705319 RepID=UPI0030C94C8C
MGEIPTLTTQIPQNFVQTIAKERGVTDAELETVFMALDGQTTAAIATKLGISDIAVRKRLGEVYKKFQIGGKGPGKLSELRHQLLLSYHQELGFRDFSPTAKGSLSKMAIAHRQQDWGEAPDVTVFYGRTQELNTLKQWIVSDNCRLVALLGLAGSGKTTLSVKLVSQIQKEFDFVVWRSWRSQPTPQLFLTNLIQFFSNHQRTDLPPENDNINGQISLLVEYLRQHRCLLIFDDFEAVLKPGELAGHYRPGWEEYRDLIVRISEVNHRSCLLVISAEEPTEIALLAGEKVRCFKPEISLEIAQNIFQEKGLSAKNSEWKILLGRYGGNLLAFKIVATTILDFFEGNVGSFLEATALFIEEHISSLLAQQLERMSTAETEITYWLTIAETPVSLGTLREEILAKYSFSDLVKNLDSLSRRSLIEKIHQGTETVFMLQPLMMKYVADRLVEKLKYEILETIKTQKIENMRLLKDYDFSINFAKKVGKYEASSYILKMVKNRLQVLCLKTKGDEELLNILNKLAYLLAEKSTFEVGYARENMALIIAQT